MISPKIFLSGLLAFSLFLAAGGSIQAAEAVAVLHPTKGNTTSGIVRFTELDGGKMRVVAEVSGLKPGSKHGIHIHEYGDCSSDDGTCAGGHYNPEGYPHALPPTAKRHAGDLGNLEADGSGNAKYELIVDNISINGKKNPVIGLAVIVHAKEDDGGQPTGNAGARLACGVIGYAMPMAK